MFKLIIATLLLLFVNTLVAGELSTPPYNSLYQRILDIQASHHPKDKVETVTAEPAHQHKHTSNSFFDAVLAKQAVQTKLLITSLEQIDMTEHDPGESTNSLFNAALSRHYKATH